MDVFVQLGQFLADFGIFLAGIAAIWYVTLKSNKS